MAWFWKKKKQADANVDVSNANTNVDVSATAAAAAAEAAVAAAVASAQRSDKEWQRQAARLRQEEKRLEKQRAKAAKRELAQMKKQARTARQERRKAEKLAQKQAHAVLKVHRHEQKAEHKRTKAIAKLRRSKEKRRKQLLRKHQKEDRRRRKQARAEEAQAEERQDAEAAGVAGEAVATTEALSTVVGLEAPPFKEDKRCKSCHSQFQRLSTRRRHHCRNCGESFCSKCLSNVKRPIPWFKLDKPQKVCFSCDVQVFSGMGGAARPGRMDSSTSVIAPSTSSPTVVSTEVACQPESGRRRSPLRAQRSASVQSEQPEDSPRSASPPSSRRGMSFRLRPRSRRDATSSKSSKNSLWTLPIRPLLKRKASADQLRNRAWDLDLRIEKEEMLARQRQSQMIVVTGAPQFATAS